MRTISVETSNPEHAHSLCDSLAAFDAEVVDDHGGPCSVRIMLEERETTTALGVIQQEVMERGWGETARIHLDGCCYMLHTG